MITKSSVHLGAKIFVARSETIMRLTRQSLSERQLNDIALLRSQRRIGGELVSLRLVHACHEDSDFPKPQHPPRKRINAGLAKSKNWFISNTSRNWPEGASEKNQKSLPILNIMENLSRTGESTEH